MATTTCHRIIPLGVEDRSRLGKDLRGVMVLGDGCDIPDFRILVENRAGIWGGEEGTNGTLRCRFGAFWESNGLAYRNVANDPQSTAPAPKI